ncbi:hypothetical protein FTUN_3039 [Frigoriglobus tundricola]|uniref:Uncharacterized protein n=1 Tax=Frigoriglobus tundricola TaxID=2774151 RepID=A0A6M5YPY2_9BACT|nr:hypothetical protein FTUN_3039 [Frigoriglobus tundricola]
MFRVSRFAIRGPGPRRPLPRPPKAKTHSPVVPTARRLWKAKALTPVNAGFGV